MARHRIKLPDVNEGLQGEDTFSLKCAYFNYTSFWLLILLYSSLLVCPKINFMRDTWKFLTFLDLPFPPLKHS